MDRLIGEIRSGKYPIGSSLPTEPYLAKSYGVSRSTLRTALARMRDMGLVERRRGAGTTVCASSPVQTYVHRMVASGDLLQFAGHTTRNIENITEIIGDEALSASLGVKPGQRWLKISQTRNASGTEVPLCWTEVLILSRKDGLEKELETWTGLFYELVERHRSLTISEIKQTVQAVGFPRDIAAKIGVDADAHCLKLQRTYLTHDGQIEIVSQSFLPGPDYSYEISLHRSIEGV